MTGRARWKRDAGSLALVVPLVALTAVVAGYPLWRAARWAAGGVSRDGAGGASGESVGGAFGRLLGDDVLGFAVLNTVGFMVAYVALLLPAGLALAVLLRRGVPGWLAGLVQGAVLSSYLVGPVYVAVMVVAAFGRSGWGVGLLERLGVGGTWLQRADVLGVPWLAMPLVVLASVWATAGWAMLYFQAALKGVEPELEEAARLDGAGRWGVFWHVTLPQVGPMAAFVSAVSAVSALQLFELPYVLFGGTAGPGNAALTLSMYLFSVAFERGDFEYAAAIGWTMSLVVSGLALLSLLLSRGPGATWGGARMEAGVARGGV